ncbi:M56 family metallopeptidase [Bizionia sp. KMM 8389]
MDIYILKSSACLAVLMLFYKFVIEKEAIHHFKRFYLISALIVSLIIPFITFTTFVKVDHVITSKNASRIEPVLPITDLEHSITISNYLPTLVYTLYWLGLLVFASRFIINIITLIKRIRKNPKNKKGKLIYVLITDLVYPHTFLEYIFLNKTKYEKGNIPKEVLLHEETHAKQKHTLDILFIETLQVFLWFNPLFYLIKRDIKLNHEFLADQAVLNTGTDTKTYQQILLACSTSKDEDYKKTNQLANAINYSLIKKRFTIMKSNTTTTVKWVKGLIILPILAVLIYSFSTKREIHQPKEPEVLINVIALKKQTKLKLKVNGTICETCEFSFNKKQIEQLKLETNSNKTITAFKIKFPGKRSTNIIGKTLNAEAITNLRKAQIGDYVTIFDLKAGENTIKTPIQIEIIENLPPPPPAPPKPENLNKLDQDKNTKTGFMIINNEKHFYVSQGNQTKYYNRWGYEVDKNGTKLSQNPTKGSDVIPGQTISNVYDNNQIVSTFKNNGEANTHKFKTPPEPPMPPIVSKSAYDFMISLENTEITYFYNNKPISYTNMLKTAKQEPNLNITSKIVNNTGTVMFTSVK